MIDINPDLLYRKKGSLTILGLRKLFGKFREHIPRPRNVGILGGPVYRTLPPRVVFQRKLDESPKFIGHTHGGVFTKLHAHQTHFVTRERHADAKEKISMVFDRYQHRSKGYSPGRS